MPTERLPASQAREQGVCTCGHPAGHHDDEPAGCWDCACESWSQNDHEPDDYCLDCGGPVPCNVDHDAP